MRNPWRPFSQPALPTAVACLLAASLVGLAASFAAYLAGRDAIFPEWVELTVRGLGEGRWWGVLSHLLLPGSALWLLLVELPVLLLAGRHLEAIVGRRHLAAIFFSAGAAGGVARVGVDALHGAADTPLAGPGFGVLGIFIALACAAPELDLVPPLALSAGGAGSRLRLRHGALGIVLAAASVVLTAEVSGVLTGARESWAAPAAGVLAAVAAACLYMRGLGFGRRTGYSPEAEAAWAAARGEDDGADEPVLAAPVAAAAGRLVVPRFTEVEWRMSPREYISARIDPILDKISRHGIGSLNDDERRLLANAREKMLRRRSM